MFSIVVVNWNGGALVEECLEALRAQTWRDFEVIVIDNGSTDDSPRRISELFPECRLIRLDRNIGFAAANNRAAAASKGQWLVLLNNDAFARPDWLEKLHEGIRRHPEFAGFASLQLQARRPDLLDGAGDSYHVSGLVWRAGFGQPFAPPWDEEREIFLACAAAAAYRSDAFRDVGGFDESFFCYVEDVDLSFRMQLRGYRFMYLPSAVVHHVGSASQGQKSSFARYHGHRNLVWCYLKNMPSALLWRHLPVHLLMNLWLLGWFSLRGEGGPIWRAKWDALKGLPRVLRQRREIQARRTVPARDLDRHMVHGLFGARR